MIDERPEAIVDRIKAFTRGEYDILDVGRPGSPSSSIHVALNNLAKRLQHRDELYQVTQQVAANNAARLVSVVDQVTNAKRELEQRQFENQELQEFAHAASHDLKAPLRGIRHMAALLERHLEGKLDGEATRFLPLIISRADHLHRLLDGLLKYAQITYRQHTVESIDTGTLARQVVDLLDPPAGLEVTIPQSMPSCSTARAPLEQTLLNLLSNAIRYSSPHGTVSLSAREVGSWIEFSVTDNGPGIAPEYHEKIFGIFETLGAPSESGGTGIGLAIVKKIVEQHGGKIAVTSMPGQGAVFRFTWPKEFAYQTQNRSQARKPVHNPLSPKATIVSIEDDPEFLMSLQELLTQGGYAVFGAHTGEAGFRLIRERRPDLVLLDLNLPDIDGLDLCSQLKQDSALRDIPVIVISAKGSECDVVVGLEMGADDYLVKEITPNEILARVKSVLRRAATKPSGGTQPVTRDGITIDAEAHRVTVDDQPIHFTATEFKLLHILFSHPGQVFSRNQLINLASGEDVFVVDRTIDVHIRAMRHKLGGHGHTIATVRGVGYRWEDRSP